MLLLFLQLRLLLTGLLQWASELGAELFPAHVLVGSIGEQECDREVGRDEAESYEEVIFGRRRPDSVVVDWANRVFFVLEFKRTSDQRRDYRERGESRAKAQHDILIKGLEKVARDADDENEGWKIKLLIFVGGTSGSR
jgi:hypothetical protein